jgi:hypothetical protein
LIEDELIACHLARFGEPAAQDCGDWVEAQGNQYELRSNVEQHVTSSNMREFVRHSSFQEACICRIG